MNQDHPVAQALASYRHYWLVSAAAVMFGTVTVGGQYFSDKGLSLYEIALFPLLFTFLMVLPGLLALRKRITLPKLSFSLTYGLIGALAELAQFGGIVLGVPVAVAALLLYSQPIWTCILSRILLDEAISRQKVVATLLTIAGIALLVKSAPGDGEYNAKGIGSALLGGVLISLWIIWGRKSGINHQHYVVTTSTWSGFSAAWLIVLWPIFAHLTPGTGLSRISVRTLIEYWPQIASFALVAGVMPGLLLFRGLQSVPASSAGVLLLLEPVSATIMAIIIFSQRLNGYVVAGGILILIANAAIVNEQ